jgi:hypothetical protein
MVRARSSILPTLLLAAASGCSEPEAPPPDTSQGDVVRVEVVPDEGLELAIAELGRRIADRTQSGWPTHVVLVDESYAPKPLVRVGEIVNRSAYQIDMQELSNRVYNALADQEVVSLTFARSGSRIDLHGARNYGSSDGDEETTEEQVSLILEGEVVPDPTSPGSRGGGGVPLAISLRVLDTSADRPVSGLEVQQSFLGVSER